MQLVKVDTALEIIEKEIASKLNFFEIMAVILDFAKDHLFEAGVFKLPTKWQVFKWIRLGKFFIDVVRIIVSGAQNEKVLKNELSRTFKKAIDKRNLALKRLDGVTYNRLGVLC